MLGIYIRSLGDRGHTLTELVVSMGIMSMFGVLLSGTLAEIYKLNTTNVNVVDTMQYRSEVKNILRNKANVADVDQKCMEMLAPQVLPHLPTMLENLITEADGPGVIESKKSAVISLGQVDLLQNENKFGVYTLENTFLKNFYLQNSREVYRKQEPGEVKKVNLIKSGYVIQLIQADLFLQLRGPSSAQPETAKPVRMKFAILRQSDGNTLLSCGTGELSGVVSHVEACKAFGPDFEFIYDNFDGQGGSGQCYAPLYDPVSIAAATGSEPMEPTSYTPLRATLCLLMQQGKSFTFPYCTGVGGGI